MFWCRGFYIDTVGRNKKSDSRVYKKLITGHFGRSNDDERIH